MDFHIIRSPENKPYVLIFGAVSLAFILYGIYCFFNAGIMEKRCTSTAEGTVTFVWYDYAKGGYYTSSDWTVSFTADDGREYTFEVKNVYNKARQGDHYTVFYDPAKPRRAYVKEAQPVSGSAWIFAGIFFAVAAYIVLFFKKNGQRLLGRSR